MLLKKGRYKVKKLMMNRRCAIVGATVLGALAGATPCFADGDIGSELLGSLDGLSSNITSLSTVVKGVLIAVLTLLGGFVIYKLIQKALSRT